MVNPYKEKIKEFSDIVFDQTPDQFSLEKRKKSFFVQQWNELTLEIGCHAGHVLVEWAEKNPDKAYIGLDWKWKQLYQAAKKAKKKKLKNVFFFRMNADNILNFFNLKCFNHVMLYFPDPWPKRAHHKKRWIQKESLSQIFSLLKEKGSLHIKTDDQSYFFHILDSIQWDQWIVKSLSHDLHKNNDFADQLSFPEVTLFEKIFIKQNVPIFDILLLKKEFLS